MRSEGSPFFATKQTKFTNPSWSCIGGLSIPAVFTGLLLKVLPEKAADSSLKRAKSLHFLCQTFCNGLGNDLFVDAAESASFPLPGTGKREGGEKTQPLHHFPSHLGSNSVEETDASFSSSTQSIQSRTPSVLYPVLFDFLRTVLPTRLSMQFVIYAFALAFGITTAVANPILYTSLNESFRQTLKARRLGAAGWRGSTASSGSAGAALRRSTMCKSDNKVWIDQRHSLAFLQCWGIRSIVMFFLRKFQLPIGLLNSCSISPTTVKRQLTVPSVLNGSWR